jgi:hypothetical protein
MKKFILTTLLGMATLGAMSQSASIGLHAGWNNAKVDVKHLRVTSRGGYMVGLFARLHPGVIYLEPSLNFVHKECGVEGNLTKEALSYSSIDIPLVVGIHLLDARLLKVRAFLGPEVSVLANKLKLKEVAANLHSSAITWNGKLGAGIDVGNLCLDADYSFGLKRLGGDARRSTSFTLTLGFKVF